jgi:hypothetical protein
VRVRLISGRGLAAASVLFLAMSNGALAAPSDTGDDELLDVLLENGSITQEQYDRLKDRGEDAPPDEASAAEPDGAASAAKSADEEGGDPVANEKVAEVVNEILEKEFPVKASYGSEGFRLETRDGNWQTNLQWRFQFRLTHPYQGDPRQLDDFAASDETSFQVRRLRMKIGGHGYRPWLKYYFELDLQPLRDEDDSPQTASTRVIDWRVDLAKWEKIGLRAGQWKIDYNRERVISSGRQEFVERSIVNRIFTVDRQIGLQLRGRLFKETLADLRYYGGVFNGQGRGVINDDNNMMYVGRLQWNFLGRDLSLRQTDVERTEKPTGSLSASGLHTIGRCTRWSSSGCGNLDGFTDPASAADGQFKINQAAQGFAFKWQGFSTDQEFHWKRVIDRVNDTKSDLYGVYAQAGYFFNEIWEKFPEPLEFAFRYAWLREPNEDAISAAIPDDSVYNQRQEFTGAANWFFAGHNNKLTLDYSYLTLDDDVASQKVDDHRVRLQWDISF